MNQFYCGLSCTMLVLTDGLILSVAKLIKRQINLFFCCPDKKVLQDLEWQQLMLNPGKIPSLIQKVWIKNCSAFCEQSVRFHRVSMCQLMSVDFWCVCELLVSWAWRRRRAVALDKKFHGFVIDFYVEISPKKSSKQQWLLIGLWKFCGFWNILTSDSCISALLFPPLCASQTS